MSSCTIIDPDVVEDSNLHRQIQFTTADVGEPKATLLAANVVARGGVARGYRTRWTLDDADDISGDADFVIDGSDDPVTKFAIADWAVAAGKPYVIAAALRYGGNVMVGAPGVACYRCLFEEPVTGGTCAVDGVLGPVVGVIGGVAAALALGVAHGDRSYAGTIFVFDDLRASGDPRIVAFAPRPGCATCARAAVQPPPRAVAGSRG